MEVRTGGTAGGAAKTDNRAAADSVAYADVTGAEVTVNGHVSAAVVDDDVVAIAACVVGAGYNLTCVGGNDVCAGGCADVNALMVAV